MTFRGRELGGVTSQCPIADLVGLAWKGGCAVAPAEALRVDSPRLRLPQAPMLGSLHRKLGNAAAHTPKPVEEALLTPPATGMNPQLRAELI